MDRFETSRAFGEVMKNVHLAGNSMIERDSRSLGMSMTPKVCRRVTNQDLGITSDLQSDGE